MRDLTINQFKVGMLVNHSEYGMGTVIRLGVFSSILVDFEDGQYWHRQYELKVIKSN